jgi:hypothetical protein
MTDPYIERVENLIRVVSNVHDEDFNLSFWCNCAIGHAMKDAYFIARGFNPMRDCCDPGHGLMPAIGQFFDISAVRAISLFIPQVGYTGARKDVLAALRVLLLEKMAQKIDDEGGGWVLDGAKPSWSAPHIEELADA